MGIFIFPQDEKFQRDPYRKPGLMSDVADWERAFQDLFGGEEGGEGDYADGQGILEPMELKRPKAKTSKTTAFVEGEGAPLAVQQKARRAGKKQGEWRNMFFVLFQSILQHFLKLAFAAAVTAALTLSSSCWCCCC